jgi:hypothetical protein
LDWNSLISLTLSNFIFLSFFWYITFLCRSSWHLKIGTVLIFHCFVPLCLFYCSGQNF